GSTRSSGRASRERVGALGPDRSHELLDPPGADHVDGTPVAQVRVQAEEPGASRVRLVQPAQVRPDQLEEADLLGVKRVDARAPLSWVLRGRRPARRSRRAIWERFTPRRSAIAERLRKSRFRARILVAVATAMVHS